MGGLVLVEQAHICPRAEEEEEEEEEEGALPEEEYYGSPRETARDDASSGDEADYRALLGSPLQHHSRAPQDGRSPLSSPHNAAR